jgi:hypothetical protein
MRKFQGLTDARSSRLMSGDRREFFCCFPHFGDKAVAPAWHGDDVTMIVRRFAQHLSERGYVAVEIHQHALNLGILYKDTVGKKRWVLKFDDEKALEQIDAVFVTLEPNGQSHKPSGKSLLFAYLKVNPNHP